MTGLALFQAPVVAQRTLGGDEKIEAASAEGASEAAASAVAASRKRPLDDE